MIEHLHAELIARYLDDASDDAARDAVESHCAACAACAADVAMHRAIAASVRRGARVEPSFDFTARVMAEIAPAPRAARMVNLPAIGLIVAALGLLFVGIFSGGSQRRATESIPSVATHVLSFGDSVAAFAHTIVNALSGADGMRVALAATALALILLADHALTAAGNAARRR